MKYAMFICVDPEATEADADAAPPIDSWFDYMIDKGAYLQGIRLRPKEDATTVQVRDGKVLVTDGPFTESREWVTGVAIIECEDLDEAIAQALKHNMAYEGRLEIRPIHSMGGPEGSLTRNEDAAASRAAASAARAARLAIVASLVSLTCDFDLAEDCFHDALERALARWPRDGIPDNPAGWLQVTARRRALDVLKRQTTERSRLQDLHAMFENYIPDPAGPSTPYDDDRLKLLFACCHPALPLAGRVALTLKTVTGLSTREIARAVLVSEATMGQRLLRTKTKIANAGIALRVPPDDQLADRIDAVLMVVYLLFNEGYFATQGEPLRDGLTREAIELGTLLLKLLPGHDEARSLLALMLLQDSRRRARVSAEGGLVPLNEQDRSLWDQAEVQAGLRLLAAPPDASPGPYRLQAAITALHATARTPEATDWERIVQAYDALLAISGTPVVALNRLIAVSYRDGPDVALAGLPDVARRLDGSPLVAATRADLLRRKGRLAEAEAAYLAAIDTTGNDAERRFLEHRLTEVRRR